MEGKKEMNYQGQFMDNFDYEQEANEEENESLQLKTTLKIEYQEGEKLLEVEQVQNVNLFKSEHNQNFISLDNLINWMKCQGFPVQDALIYYKQPGEIENETFYVFCGMDPLSPETLIPLQDAQPTLTLKIIQSFLDPIITPTICQSLEKMEGVSEQKGRRDRERKIGHVIEKVQEWRRLHQDNQKKQSLDEAATQVGIPKKSLDDYLLQLKMGRQFGFNFNEHKGDRIGVLRKYNAGVKKMYQKIKQEQIQTEEDLEKLKTGCRQRCRHSNCCVPPIQLFKDEEGLKKMQKITSQF